MGSGEMYLGVLIAVACATFFYRAADYEHMSPWVWGGASFGLSLIVYVLTGSLALILVAQVGLFLLMWWYNAKRSLPRE
jgi:hypothetical protein